MRIGWADKDEQFRQTQSTSQRDADQVTAQLASARKHTKQAQAHFGQRDSLSEQARVAKSDTASVGYGWARDPRNTRNVEALAFQLRDAQTPAQQQILIDRFIAEQSVLGRPVQYPSGAVIGWSEAGLRETHLHATATQELQDATRDVHASNAKALGQTDLSQVEHHGLIKASRESRTVHIYERRVQAASR